MSELIDRLGLKLVHLAYRYGQMIEDVAGGNFEFAVSSVGSSSADTVDMVVLLADKRVRLFPDLVTIGELGYQGSGFSGLYAPTAEVPDRLSAVCPIIFTNPAVQQMMKQVAVIPRVSGWRRVRRTVGGGQ
jgi:tripartite-type tricarboxylate transporter receptor subunit TctC